MLCLLLLAPLGACSQGKGKPNRDAAATSYKEVTARIGDIRIVVTANGVVKAIDRVELKSKASGQIEELPVEEGDPVHKGDLIARLDQKDERTAVAQAQADLDIADAELVQAERNHKRREEIFEKQLISEEERDESRRALAVARGKRVRAETTLDRARERLAESIVRAPIDGIILKKYVEEGQIIASGVSNVSGGTPIADIADMRTVYVSAGVDEIDIGKLRVHQKATVVADAYPDRSFPGTVVRVAPEARVEQNVTLFDVIVEVENTQGLLKSGMNTTLQILVEARTHVLVAPAVALRAVADGKGDANEREVLVKEAGGFVSRRIRIGMTNHRQAEVVEGLAADDVLGIPMTSRLKEENMRLERRIRSSRGFGTKREKTNERSRGG